MSGGEPSSIKRTLIVCCGQPFFVDCRSVLSFSPDGIRPYAAETRRFPLFLFGGGTLYQALYRKWRPRLFDDVVGQSHITRILKRQVMSGHLSHAYLFTGTRGTGKTTCAKLLSKAVNCLQPVEGNPCGKCEACRGIDEGSILDVVELDAASNNGVDQVRALREEAVYAPAAVKRRVYIVDEVHMLSVGAFNALLKILEEPPEHVLFILATTELHKVPATILSRCQRFSFKRIQAADIQNRLLYIAQAEGIALTEDAAALLSRLADGALRDALSLLDQCAVGGGAVDRDAVLDALGLAGNLRTAHLMNHIRRFESANALNELAQLYAAGKDVSTVLSELSGLARDLLLRQTAGAGAQGLLAGGYDEKTLNYLSNGFSPQRLLHVLNVLQDTQAKLKTSPDRRTDAELCLLRLCDQRLDGSVLSLSQRLSRLEAALASGQLSAVQTRPFAPPPREPAAEGVEAAPPPANEGAEPESLPDFLAETVPAPVPTVEPAPVSAPAKADNLLTEAPTPSPAAEQPGKVVKTAPEPEISVSIEPLPAQNEASAVPDSEVPAEPSLPAEPPPAEEPPLPSEPDLPPPAEEYPPPPLEAPPPMDIPLPEEPPPDAFAPPEEPLPPPEAVTPTRASRSRGSRRRSYARNPVTGEGDARFWQLLQRTLEEIMSPAGSTMLRVGLVMGLYWPGLLRLYVPDPSTLGWLSREPQRGQIEGAASAQAGRAVRLEVIQGPYPKLGQSAASVSAPEPDPLPLSPPSPAPAQAEPPLTPEQRRERYQELEAIGARTEQELGEGFFVIVEE